MKIFYVNQIAKDSSNSRDLSPVVAERKPYRCFTYVSVAKNWKDAVEQVKAQASLPEHWTEVFYQVHNKAGSDLNEVQSLGTTDLTVDETYSHRSAA